MNLRLVLACLMAVAVGLPTAAVSISKTLLVVSALFLLLWPSRRAPDTATARLLGPPVLIGVLVLLSLTLLWTTVPLATASAALVKHGKLIVIPLLVLFLRSRREALIALGFFVAAQSSLLLSSWLLVLGVPVPWATAATALHDHAVYSNYLGQSIMTAVLAAVCWHLRDQLRRPWMRHAAVAIAIAALASTLFVMPGRTGHLVAIAMVSLALYWYLPRRLRLIGLFLPALVAVALVAVSEPVRDRATMVLDESLAFARTNDNRTSSGERLNFWHRSVQAIAERPWTGFGLGSFNKEYNRLDAGRGNPRTFGVRNPHQEFLLWGVEAGIAGMLALAVLLACLWRDLCLGETAATRAGTSVMAALLISCMFNSTLFDADIGDFFCVAIGLLTALSLRTAPAPTPEPGR